MKVTIDLQTGARSGSVTVERQTVVERFKGGSLGSPESQLLYRLKALLNSSEALGGGWIKKRMWRDGHLVDDQQLYLRQRARKGRPCWCISSPRYQIEDAGRAFNRDGEFTFALENIGHESDEEVAP